MSHQSNKSLIVHREWDEVWVAWTMPSVILYKPSWIWSTGFWMSSYSIYSTVCAWSLVVAGGGNSWQVHHEIFGHSQWVDLTVNEWTFVDHRVSALSNTVLVVLNLDFSAVPVVLAGISILYAWLSRMVHLKVLCESYYPLPELWIWLHKTVPHAKYQVDTFKMGRWHYNASADSLWESL